jgi:hypothetical protein
VDRGYVEVPCGKKIAWESEFWRYGWILKNKLSDQKGAISQEVLVQTG